MAEWGEGAASVQGAGWLEVSVAKWVELEGGLGRGGKWGEHQAGRGCVQAEDSIATPSALTPLPTQPRLTPQQTQHAWQGSPAPLGVPPSTGSHRRRPEAVNHARPRALACGMMLCHVSWCCGSCSRLFWCRRQPLVRNSITAGREGGEQTGGEGCMQMVSNTCLHEAPEWREPRSLLLLDAPPMPCTWTCRHATSLPAPPGLIKKACSASARVHFNKALVRAVRVTCYCCLVPAIHRPSWPHFHCIPVTHSNSRLSKGPLTLVICAPWLPTMMSADLTAAAGTPGQPGQEGERKTCRSGACCVSQPGTARWRLWLQPPLLR